MVYLFYPSTYIILLFHCSASTFAHRCLHPHPARRKGYSQWVTMLSCSITLVLYNIVWSKTKRRGWKPDIVQYACRDDFSYESVFSFMLVMWLDYSLRFFLFCDICFIIYFSKSVSVANINFVPFA